MATKKKTPQKRQSLTLHQLIIAISFWGTAVRALLFAFIAAAVFVAALSEAATATAVDNQILTLIYVLGCYLLLDFGYVMVARVYRLRRLFDVPLLLLADAFLALLYVAPKLIVDSRFDGTVDPLTFAVFVPILVIAVRMLIGLLFGKRG